jgi:2-polyprenyl-3-methyl-5-hydroxy-6-metoxy-1,4-benzoquinol methylase
MRRSLFGWAASERRRCPSCGSAKYTKVARKALITMLVRCTDCKLLHRIPTDPQNFGDEYYQADYSQGITTDCPTTDELENLISRKFSGTLKNFSRDIDLFRALGISPGQRIFDFGASWGYASWQFRDAGYVVAGFELCRPRARYAREMLDLDVVDDIQAVSGTFDVFFSSHVLEHVPAPRDVFALARRLVRPGGLFLAVTPNGSVHCERADYQSYHRKWGMHHPHLLDDEFYRSEFQGNPKLLAAQPYYQPFDLARIATWDRRSDVTLDLSGGELLLVTQL